ncbi:5-formyltetrahydrofolate cyclo-ligase [Angustibacter luteus]
MRRSREDTAAGADGDRLADVVESLAPVRAASTVAAFASRGDEPSTGPLLARWRAAGRRVLLPVVRPDLDLDWAVDGGERRTSAVVDVPEPTGRLLGATAIAAAAVVLVPALAVDRRGTRLGQGGGSYDRALARTAPGTLVVAVLHPGELLDDPLPREPHDRPVHVVVTVDGVAWLSSPA